MERPTRCPSDEGFLGDSRLCIFVWMSVLHMGRFAACLQKLVVTSKSDDGEGSAEM